VCARAKGSGILFLRLRTGAKVLKLNPAAPPQNSRRLQWPVTSETLERKSRTEPRINISSNKTFRFPSSCTGPFCGKQGK